MTVNRPTDEQKAAATKVKLRSDKPGFWLDVPEINGVPIPTCTSLTLRCDALGIPKLTIEMDLPPGATDIELPADVTVNQRKFVIYGRRWRPTFDAKLPNRWRRK